MNSVMFRNMSSVMDMLDVFTYPVHLYCLENPTWNNSVLWVTKHDCFYTQKMEKQKQQKTKTAVTLGASFPISHENIY